MSGPTNLRPTGSASERVERIKTHVRGILTGWGWI